MEGTVRILRRFIGATMIISIFLVIFNFMLLVVWGFKGINEGHSPGVVVKNVAKGLHLSSNTYSLDSSSAELLNQNHAWAMLIDDTGQVAWDYRLPEELYKTYSLVDVAKFTRNYLMDYPVFVWAHDKGLVVIGYPKESLAKYQHIFPTSWVASLPLKMFSLLIGNVALALLLSLFIGSKLIRSIRPLAQGIQELAEDTEVYVEPKGVLANLAQSVNQASALLRQKNESLKSRDEARSNWIAGISHDIRTPLSMVLGYASDLEDSSDIPIEKRQQAAVIRKQAEKLRSLVSDLNLVSMLEYEMQPFNKKLIRLSTLVRQIASEFLNNGLDEHFMLEVKILDEITLVNGDERLLARAITNLIQNSINHNPDGCHIWLQTSYDKNNKNCSFIIADNGKGIARNELPELLELPFSSKRKRSSQNGHGLGLPMVARIAKAHQGHLILSSDIGKGFRAEIVLPSIKSD
ncbi:two-component sensor histidine kinase [Proteiniborus sp. DW1]|uniref:sensor histidine kinase n=1 Tax=Proteiniborus sp. DW1 TaxID=1889883 RepID=UPI00092E187B|nr:HAMP domain-containing sensor histidine kinase [Proteiniborus sp. DW1]SCG83794.1 two-component sensor histidine kinase [Proteiniborus sp. DW1]